MIIGVKKQGFTLIEILIALAIIAILAAIVVVIMNPLEVIHRSRDATRMKDLDNLAKVINATIQEVSVNSDLFVTTLCAQSGIYPCTGSSNNITDETKLTNGRGWVKANLAAQNNITVSTLPVDPVNNSSYHYTYCANDNKYEIDAVLESEKLANKVSQDGGNEGDKYEVGTNLSLIDSSGGSCQY